MSRKNRNVSIAHVARATRENANDVATSNVATNTTTTTQTHVAHANNDVTTIDDTLRTLRDAQRTKTITIGGVERAFTLNDAKKLRRTLRKMGHYILRQNATSNVTTIANV